MSLPYPSMVFVPLDVLTAEEMNQIVANIESLSAGTGLAAGAVTSDKIDSATYTTTPQIIGTTEDNKTIYRKRISLGQLPNATSQNYSIGITNISEIRKTSIICDNGRYALPIPFIDLSNTAQSISYSIDRRDGKINITTGIDRTSWTAVATIEYTV